MRDHYKALCLEEDKTSPYFTAFPTSGSGIVQVDDVVSILNESIPCKSSLAGAVFNLFVDQQHRRVQSRKGQPPGTQLYASETAIPVFVNLTDFSARRVCDEIEGMRSSMSLEKSSPLVLLCCFPVEGSFDEYFVINVQYPEGHEPIMRVLSPHPENTPVFEEKSKVMEKGICDICDALEIRPIVEKPRAQVLCYLGS